MLCKVTTVLEFSCFFSFFTAISTARSRTKVIQKSSSSLLLLLLLLLLLWRPIWDPATKILPAATCSSETRRSLWSRCRAAWRQCYKHLYLRFTVILSVFFVNPLLALLGLFYKICLQKHINQLNLTLAAIIALVWPLMAFLQNFHTLTYKSTKPIFGSPYMDFLAFYILYWPFLFIFAFTEPTIPYSILQKLGWNRP